MARNVRGLRSIRAGGRVMAAGLLPSSRGFVSEPVRVEFVMDKATMGQFLCQYLLFLLSLPFNHCYEYLSTTDVADGAFNWNTSKIPGGFTFMLPCIVIDFFLNNQPDVPVIQIYSVIKLYMFRASSLPIIRSFLQYISALLSFLQVFDDLFQAELRWNWKLP